MFQSLGTLGSRHTRCNPKSYLSCITPFTSDFGLCIQLSSQVGMLVSWWKQSSVLNLSRTQLHLAFSLHHMICHDHPALSCARLVLSASMQTYAVISWGLMMSLGYYFLVPSMWCVHRSQHVACPLWWPRQYTISVKLYNGIIKSWQKSLERTWALAVFQAAICLFPWYRSTFRSDYVANRTGKTMQTHNTTEHNIH